MEAYLRVFVNFEQNDWQYLGVKSLLLPSRRYSGEIRQSFELRR